MAVVSTIRDALKTRLAAVSGVNAYDTMPSQVLLPAAIVTPAAGNFLSEVTQDGCEDLDMVVLVLVKKVVDDVAQDAADGYLSEGSSNLANALDSGATSDWDYVVAGPARSYGEYTFGQGDQAQNYLGYEIPVTVGVS